MSSVTENLHVSSAISKNSMTNTFHNLISPPLFIQWFNESLPHHSKKYEKNIAKREMDPGCRLFGPWSFHSEGLEMLRLCLNFLAVPRQLYRWPCHWLTDWLTKYYTLLKNTIIQHSSLRDLWPLRHVMRVMRRHDLNNKKTMTKTMTMTKTKTTTKTFREHPQRLILETYDFWDIWSEW